MFCIRISSVAGMSIGSSFTQTSLPSLSDVRRFPLQSKSSGTNFPYQPE